MEPTFMTLSHVLSLTLALFFTLPIPSNAQQPTKAPPRIGVIFTIGTPDTPSPTHEAYKLGLRDLGYVEGKNIVIERRYAEGKLDRLPALAAELVRLNVDIIVTGATAPTGAAK